MSCCRIPDSYVPEQYIGRACEAIKIRSTSGTKEEIAASVALAELVQVLYFVVMAVVYTLAFFEVISAPLAGGIAIALLPVEAFCSYTTFTHYKTFSRTILTVAAIFTLTICASFALYGIVSDSFITLCAGGVAMHFFRNISEYYDAKRAKEDPVYLKDILQQKAEAAPVVCSKCSQPINEGKQA